MSPPSPEVGQVLNSFILFLGLDFEQALAPRPTHTNDRNSYLSAISLGLHSDPIIACIFLPETHRPSFTGLPLSRLMRLVTRYRRTRLSGTSSAVRILPARSRQIGTSLALGSRAVIGCCDRAGRMPRSSQGDRRPMRACSLKNRNDNPFEPVEDVMYIRTKQNTVIVDRAGKAMIKRVWRQVSTEPCLLSFEDDMSYVHPLHG